MAAKKTPAAKTQSRKPAPARSSTHRFEPAKLDSLFVVLDAIAWLDTPGTTQVAQFAGIDPRTAGKLLKNACQIGLADVVGSGYALVLPYPYKGAKDQKEAVVKEALVRLPLLTGVRQFLRLGDTTDAALRKAATIAGISPFVASDLNPLLEWAQTLGALQPNILAEDLVDAATEKKEQRHQQEKDRRIAFLSHSSVDKPFIRQLAGDLTANGVDVWLDEQRIRVGDSIPEKLAQGLAGSDFFLIAMSEHSSGSAWVQKELNNALVNEVQRRKVHILPLRLDDTPMPPIIADKKYADFSKSYKAGLEDLLTAMKGDV
ncbi:toll/interleukin-1 receptor domain-containing protein [Burkholderia cepacia]|uniref:Toll/interleukin-1 receptor domain-containing protein n=1 Tax=Burkholderia cepacia TaxID=292 RepID=A0ABM6NP34_BURCE|nr:toll/interleukin-1 receptor domain-containing protein [Burkholderia cepacia]AIO25557.1 TIR domain protein [Burkholderia cepacia ATCC 25416]ASE95141.1 toll/interleukin-1 receptor domain-containing protein [Burkholderia cepacia]ATF76680.1 toll/interleukin-1 receptor domain-containing protein [Burkholderia cepacia]MCA8467579.1 toll/interleukin-1 receptor domain-containing protein [Burkholderia cepacia]MDN7763488.1 toll/interleukin-1 receptor domain-containing protein [Burkholderia cepacia]